MNKLPLKQFHEEFVIACGDGDINIIKDYYEQLADLKIEDNELYRTIVSDGVYHASKESHWNVLQYIIEQNYDDLGKYGYFNIKGLLQIAATINQPNFVRYLLDANKEKNLNINLDLPFENALKSKDFETIQIFIFEYNIKKTTYIERCLDLNYCGIGEEVSKMFETRELEAKLSEELVNPQQSNLISKKAKI